MSNYFRTDGVLMLFVKCLLGILFLIFSQTLFAEQIAGAPDKFISFSDIHFNPFANCKTLSLTACSLIGKLREAPATQWQSIFEQYDNSDIAGFMHDTNYALLKSSLAEINKVYLSEHPRFAIILGDFLAHNYRAQYVLYAHDKSLAGYQSFVKKTFQFLAIAVRQAIPAGDIYPVVGNNDSYTGDYNVQAHGGFLHDLSVTWAPLISNSDNQKNLRMNFPQYGFYAVTLPDNPSQKFLLLNTVLFSTAVRGHGVNQAANAQLNWLREQLEGARAAHQSVILAFHIPDGVNVYMTLLNIFHGVDEFWQRNYSKKFNELLHEYAETIKAILPGHIHMDSFQVIGTQHENDVPVSFTPSISPIFGNNPGFKVYSYDDKSLQLLNYDVYFYPLNEMPIDRVWRKEYNFNQVYHQNCPVCALINGMKNLTPAGTLANHFKKFYAVSTEAQPIIKANYWLPYYWCNIFAVGVDAYEACIKH
jgi:sphingomyelin phosphodiesterase acid-like 3